MSVVSMKSLLETGVHFGHRTRRWNPKMKPFIFTERNGVHILDLQQTIVMIDDCYNMVRDTVADGGTVLFVGTKRQAYEAIAGEATRANMPYVNERWLGGTLTNWSTIRQRISHLDDLEKRKENGEFDGLKKKELLMIQREMDKLQLRLGGIRKMNGLPDLIFVVDVKNEETAIREANKLEIPIIAMVDTNCDPDNIDFVIPSNDDAIRAIRLMAGTIADAAIEGANLRKDANGEQAVTNFDTYTYEEGEAIQQLSDEELLGSSTLAKITEEKEARAEATEAAEAATTEAAATDTAAATEESAPASAE